MVQPFRAGQTVALRTTAALLLAVISILAQPSGPAMLSPAAAAGGIEPLRQTLRVALSNASSSNAGVYVADGLGYFAQQGLQIEYPNLGGSASEIAAAIASNRIDIADVGINPAMFNTAGTGSFKIVADKGSLQKGFGFISIVVRKDLAQQIRGPQDLKGLSMAMTPPGLGTANGYALSIYLARASLTVQDVHIQPIPFPEQLAALSNKAVPVAMMTEPFVTQAVKNDIGVRLITVDEIVPGQQVAAITYSTRFIATHRLLAEKFMIAYVQGIRAYNAAFERGADKARIIQILATWTPIKDQKLWAEMIPAGLSPTGRVNAQSIQQAEDFFHQIGLVAQPPALSTLIDNSFADYANKVLGPAR